MAGLPQEKLKQMEAEMDRFEQEISEQPGSQGRFIIGTHTFTHVQEKLKDPKAPPGPGGHMPPPPPPPMMNMPPGGPVTQGVSSLPPPPPPPLRPTFTPPQIRQRPPMRPPPPPPMGGPGGPPPRPPPFNPSHNGPPPYNNGPNQPYPNPPYSSQPPPRNYYSSGPQMYNKPPTAGPSEPIIEKPKMVYSAPPMRNMPKVEEKVEEKKEEVKVEEPPAKQAKTTAAPGIELNVPIQEIMAEQTAYTSATEMGLSEPSVVMPSEKDRKKEKKKKLIRMAAGQTWEDLTLVEWNPDDFRIFCGDLGNEVTDEVLARAFSHYPSFQKAKVIRDKRTNKTRGYGFVSFRDPNDFVKAMREMNGKYVGNRPIKLRKSCWKDRNIEIVKKKEKEKKRLGLR